MERRITADEVRAFFQAANRQFEAAGFLLKAARFERDTDTRALTGIHLTYEGRQLDGKEEGGGDAV